MSAVLYSELDHIPHASGIYGIFCVETGKIYVGQSVDMRARLAGHLCLLTHKKHFNSYLQRAFSKYGRQFFEYRVLELVSANMLDVRELAWAEYYKATDSAHGFNLDIPGESRRHSKETKKKMSLAGLGRRGTPWSSERREAASAALKGKPTHPNSMRALEKIHEGRRGTTLAESTKKKISVALTGRPGNKKSAEERRAISDRMRAAGPKVWAPLVAAASKANRGRKHTAEEIAKRSKTVKAWWTPERRAERGRQMRAIWERRRASAETIGESA